MSIRLKYQLQKDAKEQFKALTWLAITKQNGAPFNKKYKSSGYEGIGLCISVILGVKATLKEFSSSRSWI